jgi:hypothetical protein
MHPAVQPRSAFLTASTRLDSHRIRDAFDSIAQTCFLLDKETWKTNAVRLAFHFLLADLGACLHLCNTPSVLSRS